MYGQPPHLRPPGGGRDQPPPHRPPPQPPSLPNSYFQYPNLYFQNPALQLLQNFALPNQLPHFQIQRNDFPVENPNFPPQQLSNIMLPPQPLPSLLPQPLIQQPPPSQLQPPPPQPQPQQQLQASNRKELLERIDVAVAKSHRDLLAARENVSAWKVSQAALLTLRVDSWGSLGFQMQEVPSLNRLIVTEGKINAFIHCFVGVRWITSLHDLEVAICKNEGVERFEELELGPLLRHPLVLHYFSVKLDATEVSKMTTGDVISYLCEFLDTSFKKDVQVEEFVDFIVKKQSVSSKENLALRIQNLGKHISYLREARKLEDATLNRCLKSLKKRSENKRKKRPLFSLQKKQLDERFSALSQRVKSFSSAHEDFGAKHTIFLSSCSEDEDSDYCKKDAKEHEGKVNNYSKLSSQTKNDRVSSCPYPSAIEEMTRLGLKVEMDTDVSPSQCFNYAGDAPPRKRRKTKNATCSISSPEKEIRRAEINMDALSGGNDHEEKDDDRFNEDEFSLAYSSMRTFISTWKETCREQNVAQVLKGMLQSYNTRRRHRKRILSMFSTYPCLGLLNIAVTSIKYGMWDNIYDTLQAIDHDGVDIVVADEDAQYEIIDVQPSEKNLAVSAKATHSVSIEDVIGKLAAFVELDNGLQVNGKSLSEMQYYIYKKLHDCELWLAEQFSVKEFKCLGHGDFLTFLVKYCSVLPGEVNKFLTDEVCENTPFGVCIQQDQLVWLISQAADNLWGIETITDQRISMLLQKQFPVLNFRIVSNGSLEGFLEIVRENRNSVTSKCVLYSMSMLGLSYNGDSFTDDGVDLFETKVEGSGLSHKTGRSLQAAYNDAVELLLKAPMLSDLSSWSHWEHKFAHLLGRLVEFLLNEVNTKELLCLVTKDGKVLRIDHSATVDSFLEAAVRGSSFLTAVKLLSFFSLVGGEKHVPLSLLKSQACRAFEVIIMNSLDSVDAGVCQNSVVLGKGFQDKLLGHDLTEKAGAYNKAVALASRFFLDCLDYVPPEFHAFFTDVLLTGLRSVIKDATSVILKECKTLQQRMFLHEVGFSLGIVEWINDYDIFISNAAKGSAASSIPCISAAAPELIPGLRCMDGVLKEISPSKAEISVPGASGTSLCTGVECATVNADEIANGDAHLSVELNEFTDAALLIESIRRDEFGLDPAISVAETSMLKKQHARLGRALHCLSQELYSQDSHFLLELVQNADDNLYLENVEPTLTFILQDWGIVVLNNEQGFSAENIRALCDIGNSTKKGYRAGYIGHKGIGFKSVFRVTDAPEIHSNGFHVKFDVTEGQIGFVLPTLIPARNVNVFSRLVSGDADQENNSCWNTCIVLPFKWTLSEENTMSRILTMFSDLDPSLLLFLHRLQCIRFRNLLNGTLVIMRKEILGNNIVKVSHGKDEVTWLVVSRKLRSDFIRHDVQNTEIAMAFTLQEADSGSYIPYLVQQPVFAFLPLRTYGLKFILQGDFVLPSSREEVDGNSPWNQWLLSEFPELFLTAKDSFCALPCFRENQGKAVSAYLTFVPLLGEVHGFFSSLPRMIISRLRMTNCLLLEGDCTEWVPPCKVLRGWDDQAQTLLTNGLLQEHLGLGFLNKEIVLSDQLAGALGIEEYGPKILIQLLSSLSNRENALGSLGLGWLSHLLSVLSMSFQSASHNPEASRVEKVLVKNLQKIAFIPLSDGTFSSLDDGTIWLHIDSLRTGSDGENGLKAFPHIFTKLRIVSPALFSAMEADLSCLDADLVSNLTKILQKIGVQWLTAHEITKVHILPNLSVDRNCMDRDLMIEYVCFAMIHLQSGCHTCQVEREQIISELQNKAFILTNYGFRRTVEVPIHFSEEYGNPAIMHELTKGTEMRWHVVDSAYLKHPVTKSLSSGPMKWREFFQEIGITDFLQVVLIQKGVTDLCSETSKKILLGVDFVGPELVARDWESHELVQILSLLCESGSKESCEYLLEVLDKFWDNHFSDKVKGYCYSTSSGEAKPFRSSFMDSICDTQWVVSSMDGNLHYPRDLFYDCEAVRLILGASAPYAVPKVRSSKLLAEIGFKTKVTVDDALEILQVWKRSGVFFKASVAQMARLYTFIWNELASCQIRSTEEMRARLFIFIPSVSGFQHEDLVCGIFCSPEEVYWHDSTGSVECLNEVYSQCGLMNATNSLPWQTLAKTYSGLYDFFVKECGVLEGPPFHVYLEMLAELSSTVSPSRAANVIFQILLKWSDGLDSGSLCTEDISYFKERLAEQDYTVLPTEKEKWVSLHPSFGTVCWCDDESLRKEFKCVSGIHFVCFGQPDWKILPTKVSTFLQTLGIPALSEVVSREAIYCGPANSSLKASLIDWALPYAQRYIYNVHPQRYLQLKQSGFNFLKNLEVVVVEKLFYRNVVKSCGNSSKKYECNCILQGNILYVAEQSDSHALFLELSRLWFDGTTELHTANFLHMITIMVESGSTAEQIEIFILNSQKVTKIPDEETIWSLASLAYSTEHSKLPQKGSTSAEAKEQSASKSRRKSGSISNWPPVDWRTAPDTSCASENDPWIQALAARSHVSLSNSMEGGSDITVAMIDTVVPDEFNADWKVVAGNSASSAAVLPSIEYHEDQFGQVNVDVDSAMSMELTSASDRPGKNSLIFNRREKLNTGTSDGAQALLTGRLGEIFAFRYFTEKVSNTVVRWVNENGETGLPYDIVVGENEVDREYIEVKATLSGRKDWFHISTREMQFALEQGESFSIAHVLVGHNNARISVFKNPIKLCQQGKLQLVVMMPGLEERTGAL